MEVVRAACLALVAALAFGQTTSRIEGRVLSDTGQPLSKTTLTLLRIVTINPATTTAGASQPRSFSMEASEDGKFLFPNLPPGQYSLRIQRSGYVSKTRDTRLWLSAGQVLSDLEFRLIPQGVITGRVTDRDGDPVVNTGVTAYRTTFSRNGKQILNGGSTTTDEHGNYRISGLAPGLYYLHAASRPAGELYWRYTFFPSSVDFAGASAIDVAPGAELHGMDILTRSDQPHFSIRGTAVNMNTGEPIHAQALMLAFRDGRRSGGPNGSVKADGSFVIPNVEPGTVFVQTLFSTTDWSNMGQVEVAVGNHDVDGVVLPVRPAMTIKGTVQVEDGAILTRQPLVTLLPVDIPFNGSDPTGQADAGGSFELENVAPVKYLVELHNLPEGTYVKSIHLADRDITHAPMDLTSGVEAALTVLLAPHAAMVDGVVKPNAVVAIWRKDHADEVSTALADQKGAFRFANLAPGDYRILAWDDIEPGLAEYEPFRTRFNDRAIDMTLSGFAPSKDQQLRQEVPLIPHESAEAELARIP